MMWTVYIGMDCGCTQGPFTPVSTADKDAWKAKHDEPIYCKKHDWYSRLSRVMAHGN